MKCEGQWFAKGWGYTIADIVEVFIFLTHLLIIVVENDLRVESLLYIAQIPLQITK